MIPFFVTFLLNLRDDILETVSPVAGGAVVVVVDVTTSDLSGKFIAFNGSVVGGDVTESVEFGGDCLPGVDGFLDTVGGLVGNFLESFIRKF